MVKHYYQEKRRKTKSMAKSSIKLNENKVVTGPFNRVKGGMSVDLDGVVAFLPGSQIETRQIIKDTKELLNKPLELMILKWINIEETLLYQGKQLQKTS